MGWQDVLLMCIGAAIPPAAFIAVSEIRFRRWLKRSRREERARHLAWCDEMDKMIADGERAREAILSRREP